MRFSEDMSSDLAYPLFGFVSFWFYVYDSIYMCVFFLVFVFMFQNVIKIAVMLTICKYFL